MWKVYKNTKRYIHINEYTVHVTLGERNVLPSKEQSVHFLKGIVSRDENFNIFLGQKIYFLKER